MINRRKILKVTGYISFAVLAFSLNFYWTLPDDAIGQRIAYEMTHLCSGPCTVDFTEFRVYGLTGFKAKQMVFKGASKDNGEQKQIVFDNIRIRMRMLPLLIGRISFTANVPMGAGDIDLVVSVKAKELLSSSGGTNVLARLGNAQIDFAIKMNDAELGTSPWIADWTSMPLGGTLVGQVDGIWDGKDAMKSTGRAAVRLDKFSMGPGTLGGFTLPALDMGQVDMLINLEQGRARISTYKQTGGVLQTDVSVSTLIRPEFKQSTLDVCIKLKAEQSFLTENPKMATVMQLAEATLRKDPSGFLHIPLGGSVGAPRLRPSLCQKIR